VVGLTVVALGTSAPEIAVSARGALAGAPDVALGNVVGSNVFNVLLVLGLAALIAPLAVPQQVVRLDVPILIVASCTALLFALDGRLSSLEATLLLAGAVGYTVFLIRSSRRESAEVADEYARGLAPGVRGTRAVAGQLALVAAGLAMLVIGARWLVDGAVELARALALSEQVIGLTVVAAGTSLPEAATSVLASLRGERDIAVGNVVGSNVFNVLGVLGVAGALAGGIDVAPAILRFDLPVMTAVALACLPIFFSEHRIARWEGALFLAYYVAYTAYLVLEATEHDALPAFSGAMAFFVLPLTVVTLAVVGWREHVARRAAAR